MTTTEITRLTQIDGTIRVVSAQDANHARRARAILRTNPAMIDCLHGVDGIVISTRIEVQS
jgi:hypothetical protein